MESGLKSLWGSLKAFFGFWVAFVFATICNTLLPCDSLRHNFFFKYVVTDGMVELRRKIVRLVMYGGPTSVIDAAVVMFQNATYNFFGYFKEIFVIVTFLHFTPLLEGLEIHFMIPWWLKRLLRRVGYNFTPKQEQENEDFYAQFEDENEVESPSEPPPLEDISHLLDPESPVVAPVSTPWTEKAPNFENNECFDSSKQNGGGGGSGVSSTGTTPCSDTSAHTSNNSVHSVHSLNVSSSLSQDSQLSKPQSVSRQTSQTKQKERYVYDPVYGVILQETRDLWQVQEDESQHRKRALLEAMLGEKPLPPVRFSGVAI